MKKTYKDFITDKNEFLFSSLLTKLVLTTNGLFRLSNAEFSGSCIIVDNKVYRPTKYVIFENWFSFLSYYKSNKGLINLISKKFFINLDDGDCCADGHICFINKNANKHYNEQTTAIVPFNTIVHNAIKSHLF